MKEQKIKEIFKECSEIITEKTQEIHQLILGKGNVDSPIIFLVDAPGAEEETVREPIAGRAKEKLSEFISYIGKSYEEIYVSNLVKYRPYKVNIKTGRVVNRSLKKDEISFFVPYLEKEIDIIGAKIIVTLGTNVLNAVIGEKVKLVEEHGKARNIEILGNDYIIYPMYHPMAMIYSQGVENGDLEGLLDLIGDAEKQSKEIGETEAEKQNKKTVETEVVQDSKETKIEEIRPVEEIKEATIQKDEKDVEIKVPKKSLFGTFYESKMKKSDKKNKESTTSQNIKLNTAITDKEIDATSSEMSDFRSGAKMRTLLVYGGGDIKNDPTHEVCDCISSVLAELDASIIKFDLNRDDLDLEGFVQELEYANSVVLATSVEWYGIGGLMQQFLDKCWKISNKEFFENIYLMGVVISKQGYERDAYNHLIKSWELLGGLEGVSLCAQLTRSMALDTKQGLLTTIEKKAEEFYRLTTANREVLPTSIRSNRTLIEVPNVVDVIEERKEGQASKKIVAKKKDAKKLIINYDEFIGQQQQDIEDISNIFKQKLQQKNTDVLKTEVEIFKEKFIGSENGSSYIIQWEVVDKKSNNTVLEIKGNHIKAYFGNTSDQTMVITLDYKSFKQIIEGKVSIQRGFMTGQIKVKGDFAVIYKLDKMFALG